MPKKYEKVENVTKSSHFLLLLRLNIQQIKMILDIIVVLVVAFGFYSGFSRGLIKTVFDTLSLIIGILAAMKLSGFTINILQNTLNLDQSIAYLLGIVITFIIVMFLIRFIGKRLENIFVAANINALNKLAGGVLQGLFFAFLMSLLIWVLGNYNVLKPETKDRSITYPLLEPLPEAGKSVFTAVKPFFQEFWNKTVDVMDNLGNKIDNKQQEG